MRALLLTIVLLASTSLNPLLAQDEGKSSPNAAQTGPSSSGQAKPEPQSTSEHQKRRILNRMGPGIDWDHRKAGRDWKISPHHEKNDADRRRSGDG